MTIKQIRTYQFICNNCGFIEDEHEPSPNTMKQARKDAAVDGWLSLHDWDGDGKLIDICPDCAQPENEDENN